MVEKSWGYMPNTRKSTQNKPVVSNDWIVLTFPSQRNLKSKSWVIFSQVQLIHIQVKKLWIFNFQELQHNSHLQWFFLLCVASQQLGLSESCEEAKCLGIMNPEALVHSCFTLSANGQEISLLNSGTFKHIGRMPHIHSLGRCKKNTSILALCK